MRFAIRLAAAALIAASVMPGPATAAVESSCGGQWTYENQCTFFLAAPHFYIQGTTNEYVNVAVTDPINGNILLHCHGSGRGCSAQAGPSIDEPGPPTPLPIGVPLVCKVWGIQSGAYSCTSGF